MTKRARKRVARARVQLPRPTAANQSWSIDYMSDATADSRRVRVFNVVDDYTREAATEVNRSINAAAMIEALDRFAADRGGVKVNFIEPGRPVQNCYIESFNGRMRDECLNQNWFTDLDDARRIITGWTDEYNEEREHGALGMTPREFARSRYKRLR